jgi:four helix bundle protein
MESRYDLVDSSPDVMEDGESEYSANRDFTTLDAWTRSRLVKLFFYAEVIPLLPVEEKFNLGVQIRKACVSITANIAEGYGRYHYQEGIQFYRIARASLYELKDHLTTCSDLNYVTQACATKGMELIERAKVKLNGYIKYVKGRKDIGI